MVLSSPQFTAWHRRFAVAIVSSVLALGGAGCGDGGGQLADSGAEDGGHGDAEASDGALPTDMGEDAAGEDAGGLDAGGLDASVDPTLDPLDDITIDEDEPATLMLDLTSALVGSSLVLTVSSSDPSVLAESGVAISGTGVDRTVVLTPVANASGTTTITVTVVVDGVTVEESFVLTVSPVDDPPSLGAITSVVIDEEGTTGPLTFTVTAVDPEEDLSFITLTATSSDVDVIPNENIVFGVQSPGVRTVTVTPSAGRSSASPITITITVMDDDGLTSSTTFDVTVTPENDAPTVVAPDDQSMLEDEADRMLSFDFGDVEVASADLVVTAVSSMPAILGVSIGGSGDVREVTLDPQANRFGTVTVTLSVSDGELTAMDTFDVTITPVNDAPVLSTTATLPFEVNEDAGTFTIPFTVVDIDIDGVFPPQVPAQTLSYLTTYTGEPAALITDAHVMGNTVVVTLGANLYGDETITLTVADDGTPGLSSQLVLPLHVLPANDAPTITQVANQAFPEDSGVHSYTFDVADEDLPGQSIAVSVSSSNAGLLQNVGVSPPVGGARTVTLSLQTVADLVGSTTITVSATDGIDTTTMSFTVNVTQINDPPTIVLNSPDPQTTTVNTPTGAISFTITDIDSPPCSLTLSSSTTTPTLLPTRTFSPACTAIGNSATRTITITPGMFQSGEGLVTLRVTDGGGLFAQWTFSVIVVPPT